MIQSHLHLILLVNTRNKDNPDLRGEKQTLLLDKELLKHIANSVHLGRWE